MTGDSKLYIIHTYCDIEYGAGVDVPRNGWLILYDHVTYLGKF